MADFAMRSHGIVLDADPVDLAEAYAKAEQIKKELSSRERAQAALIAGGKRMTFELTRMEFTGMLSEHLENVELAVETCLDNADLRPADMDAVLMVGGSSRIPAFQELLRRYFGRDPQFSRNLDEDVARGAALDRSAQDRHSRSAQRAGRPASPGRPLLPRHRRERAERRRHRRQRVVLPANAPIPTDAAGGTDLRRCTMTGRTRSTSWSTRVRSSTCRFVARLGERHRKAGRPEAAWLPDHREDGAGRRRHPACDGRTTATNGALDHPARGAA